MREDHLENYPELEKFIQLYWHQAASNFVEQFLQFREDALSTPGTFPLFAKCVDQMRKAFDAGMIRKKLPRTLQVEFWGRANRYIVLEDYEAALKALEEIESR